MKMTIRGFTAIAALLVLASTAMAETEFQRARAEHETSVGFTDRVRYPAPLPPAETLNYVFYPSEVGDLAAYVTPPPNDGERHPAIIWIHGGQYQMLDDMWSPRPRNNDQTAAAYRQAGIVMMFPSFRGAQENPGESEGYFGEIDDLLAAADYLESLPWVDPDRIYLGGHSTGGTLVFLTAEVTDRFRAVFAFGPAADGTQFGQWLIPVVFERKPHWERRLRSPILWMGSVRTPLYVIEAASGNSAHLRRMQRRNSNPLISFNIVRGVTHNSILAPVNDVIAQHILDDDLENPEFVLDMGEVHRAVNPGNN